MLNLSTVHAVARHLGPRYKRVLHFAVFEFYQQVFFTSPSVYCQLITAKEYYFSIFAKEKIIEK